MSENSSSNMVHNGRADPALFLNPQAMIHVLSFVEPMPTPSRRGGPSSALSVAGGTTSAQNNRYYEDEDFDEMDIEEDGEDGRVDSSENEMENNATARFPRLFGYSAPKVRTFHAQLESISSAWRSLVSEPAIAQSVQLELDFDSMTDAFEDRGIAWVRSRKFPIKSIRCGNKKLFVLASKVLKDCDTSWLTSAKLTLSLPDDSPAHCQYFHGNGSFSSQGHFQQTLATECPRLRHLDLVLKVKSGTTSFDEAIRSGPALFSHSKITSLNILLFAENANDLERETISKCIEHFPSLRSLTLRCNSNTTAVPFFRIHSKSLEILRVSDFFPKKVNLSLDCPRLQHLYLKDWGRNIWPPVLLWLFDPMTGPGPMNVPDSCIVHPTGSTAFPQPFPVSRLRGWRGAFFGPVIP